MDKVTSVLLVGVGGQGVLKASDILSRAAFLSGLDVKKSEIHGMSQRGGGVTSTVRFGEKVFSPLAPEGSVDLLIALDAAEGEKYRGAVAEGGRVVFHDEGLVSMLSNRRTANVALLGVAAAALDIRDEIWEKAIAAEMKARHVDMNIEAFRTGREFSSKHKGEEG